MKKIFKKVTVTICAVFLAFNLAVAIPDVGQGTGGTIPTGGCNSPTGTFGKYECKDVTGTTVDVICGADAGKALDCNGVTMECPPGSS